MPRRARPFARRALVPIAMSGALVAAPAPVSAAGKRSPRAATPVVKPGLGSAARGEVTRATSRAARVRGRKFR